MPIGERLHTTPRYVRHPPVATWPWRDGRSVDAGTAHIVHNNLSHLSERNLRHIANLQGPGAVLGYANTNASNAYLARNIQDAQRPADGTTGVDLKLLQISWDRTYDCLMAGPIPAVGVNLQTDPLGYVPRAIRIRVVGAKTLPTGYLYFVTALTLGPVPPNLVRPLVVSGSSDYTAVGPVTFEVASLVPTGPILPTREFTSRPDGATTTRVADLYVWVGWLTTNTDGTPANQDRVYSVDIWETL